MPTTTERAASTVSSKDQVTRAVHRRAIEAVIWGMPAVNFDLLYQSMVRAKGAWNQVVYWSRLPDWKNQTLTPNPDVLYFFPFINTKDVGPVVLEIPPAGSEGSITGSVDDAWQTAIEDVGPAGVDKGKGGKYLILPPGYKEKVPRATSPCRLPLPELRHSALQPCDRQCRRCGEGRCLWQAGQGLSVRVRGEAAGDRLRRRD